jgi:uncharacterized protein (TIGR03435 family)
MRGIVTIQSGRSILRRWPQALPAFLAAALFAVCLLIPSLVQSATQAAQPVPGNTPSSATTPSSQASMVPWMVAAGGHAQFDVVSVKPDSADMSAESVHSNVPLGPMDSFTSTGGLLQASNFPLLQYIVFAYKLTSTQVQSVQSQLPKWANTNRYDIEGRTSGNPTKDQYRLMMQALLADRFKLSLHYDTKQIPVLALELDRPGKFGPHFQLHPADAPPCSSAPAPGATVDGGFPQQCGVISAGQASAPGRIKIAARNIPLAMLTNLLGSQPIININKPVVDKTAINGNVDLMFEFSPEVPPGVDFQADPNGPTFLEALKDQLGMKLESTTAPVDSIVIDHVEEPSEN